MNYTQKALMEFKDEFVEDNEMLLPEDGSPERVLDWLSTKLEEAQKFGYGKGLEYGMETKADAHRKGYAEGQKAGRVEALKEVQDIVYQSPGFACKHSNQRSVIYFEDIFLEIEKLSELSKEGSTDR